MTYEHALTKYGSLLKFRKRNKPQVHDLNLSVIGQDVTTPKVQTPHIGERNIIERSILC